MKVIVTKAKKEKSKSKDSDKANLSTYWEMEFPEEYVDALIAKATPVTLSKLASKLVEVDLRGTLQETEDGFVYLDIPNEIIDAFLPLIGDEAEKPPYNEGDFGSVGAHISVIGDSERRDNEIKDIKEIGEDFAFRIKGLYSVRPEGWDEMKRVWFITVSSEELESLREGYGLTPLKKGHDFHITLACLPTKE